MPPSGWPVPGESVVAPEAGGPEEGGMAAPAGLNMQADWLHGVAALSGPQLT